MRGVRFWVTAGADRRFCGDGTGAAGDYYMAATIDGQQWRTTAQGSELTTAGGITSLTILGYTPLAPGSKQADGTKPQSTSSRRRHVYFVAPRSATHPQPVNVTDGSFHAPIGP